MKKEPLPLINDFLKVITGFFKKSSRPSQRQKKRKAKSLKSNTSTKRNRTVSKSTKWQVKRVRKIKRPAKVKRSKSIPKTGKVIVQSGEYIGDITHYFSRIQVAVVEVKNGKLALGDKVEVRGKAKSFTQKVQSMQIESVDVKSAKKGQVIGLKVVREAKVGDKLYKL